MSDPQSIVVVAVSVASVAFVVNAAIDVRDSNGPTARAFSRLLYCLAAGLLIVTGVELSRSINTWEAAGIVTARLVKVGGVIYFRRYLKRKTKAGAPEKVTADGTIDGPKQPPHAGDGE